MIELLAPVSRDIWELTYVGNVDGMTAADRAERLGMFEVAGLLRRSEQT
jgi:hypothetical protein